MIRVISPVVGNIGEQQAIGIAEPDRAFYPVKAGCQLLDRGIAHHEAGEFRFQSLEETHLISPSFVFRPRVMLSISQTI
jgi:hypothetical protein